MNAILLVDFKLRWSGAPSPWLFQVDFVHDVIATAVSSTFFLKNILKSLTLAENVEMKGQTEKLKERKI